MLYSCTHMATVGVKGGCYMARNYLRRVRRRRLAVEDGTGDAGGGHGTGEGRQSAGGSRHPGRGTEVVGR